MISGFGTDDSIQLPTGTSSLLAVSSNSNAVQLVTNYNGVVTRVDLSGIVTTSNLIFDAASFNALPVGDIAFNGAYFGATLFGLDSLGGTLASPALVDASFGAFSFTDAASQQSASTIGGFGADDQLIFSGATADDIAVSSQNSNINIAFNIGGVVSIVNLIGVVAQDQIVFDLTSFNALPLGNIVL